MPAKIIIRIYDTRGVRFLLILLPFFFLPATTTLKPALGPFHVVVVVVVVHVVEIRRHEFVHYSCCFRVF